MELFNEMVSKLSYSGNEKQLKSNFDLDFQSIQRMIPYKETKYATHYLHKYPGKFLPHFPKIFIKHFLSNHSEIVLDPMCGSGTTLIESCLAGYRCIGIEIDPIGYLISKVATTPLPKEKIKIEYTKLLKKIKRDLDKRAHYKVHIPNEEEFPNALLWFREDVLKELIYIRDIILTLKNKDFQNFLLLSLSSIVRSVSNADPRDIFPQRDKNLLVRKRKNIIDELKCALDQNIDAINDFSNHLPHKPQCNIIKGDARNIHIPENSIDFVFTSPPYAYAMDYARINQLSTLLLVMKNQKLREYRKLYVGTDRVPSNRYNIIDGHFPNYEGFEFASKEIESVYKKNKRYGLCLYQYFIDMYRITEEIYRVLKPRHYIVYIVGNSTINRTQFHTDKVFQSICKNIGFIIEDILERPYYAYRMTRKRNIQSNTIKKDVFIIAKKE